MSAEIQALESLFNRGVIHIVGITSYRSARAKDVFLTTDRANVSFLENRIKTKDNHVVLIFQVLWGENGWPTGTYYIHLHDLWAQVGKDIEWTRNY